MKQQLLIHLISGLMVVLTMLTPCKSQTDLTTDDKREISYQAKMLIKEYEILLNVLSMKGTTLNESQILIQNSYTPSSTQIFTDSLIVIEDDLDPIHTTQLQNAPVRIPARDYLNAIYLLYEKSDQPSIEFSTIKSSKVQKKQYVYVQVLFDSKFSNEHKEVNTPYGPTNRIAEVRAEFVNNTWKTEIVSVTFWDESRTFQDTVYTTESSAILASLKDKNATSIRLNSVNESTSTSSPVTEADRRKYEEYMKARMDSMAKKYYEDYYNKIQLREERERKEMLAQYNSKMKIYQVAMDNGNYDQAKMILEETLPFATTAKQAQVKNEMIKVERIIADRVRVEREKLQAAQDKARRFSAMKYYSQAINWYRTALDLNPRLYHLQDSVSQMSKMKARIDPYFTIISQKNYDEAVKELNREIKDNKDVADFYMLRGLASAYDGKAKRAFKDYSEAIAISPNFRDAYIYRGNLHLQEQEINDAIADYGMALAIYDQDTSLLLRRADLNLKIQQPLKAIEDLGRAISVYPDKADWYMRRGKLYRNSQQYTQALNDFTEATALTPKDPQTWFFKGLAYVDLNDIYGAAAEFEKARSLNLDLTSLQTIQAIADNLYKRGLETSQRTDHISAIEFFNGAIAIVPAYKEAWFAMGEARMAINDPLSAIENFTEAINLDNKYFMAFHNRGLARVANNQPSLAVQDFDQAGRISPSFLQAHLKSGETYTQINEFGQAIQAYNRALRINPEMEQIHTDMGVLYLKMNNLPKALSSLNTALDLNDEYPNAYYQRGLAYVDAKNFKKAEKDFSEAIKYNSNYAEAYLERGKIYHYQDEKPSKAIEDFTSAINAKADYVEALLERGKASYVEEDFIGSLTDIRKAVYLNDRLLDDPQIRYYLGFGYLHSGKINDARVNFTQAQGMQGAHEPSLLLGLAYCDLLENKLETGFTLMEQAFKTGTFNKKEIKKSDLSKPVKRDGRFKRLVKQYL